MPHFNKTRIITDLREFIKLLKKFKFNTGLLDVYQLEDIVKKGIKAKSFEIKGMTFKISNSGMDSLPCVKNIIVYLDTNYTLANKLSEDKDVFSKYTFQLSIRGYNDDIENFNFFSWHLDREPKTKGNLIHPYYHLHAGGNRLKGYQVGELLMIGSPRIPHPPMDIIMAIHFIILNFLNSKDFKEHKKILDDDEYKGIIKRAQQRVLDPYFKCFSKTHDVFTKQNLFPLYV